MRLTFSEDFNSLSLNTGTSATADSRWTTTYSGGVRSLKRNGELQFYIDPDFKGLATKALGLNPFSVSNGVLTISAKPAPLSAIPFLDGLGYTSGVLTTQNSFSQKYGYFEIRAKTTDEQGLWPAFWMLKAGGGWPPEVDILEQVGHTTNYNNNGIVSAQYGKQQVFAKNSALGFDSSEGFHTYGLDWTADYMTFYVDGEQKYKVATPGDFHSSMYMVVNLAIGGSWAGKPDGTTDWSQAKLQVDYIKAYAHDGDSASPIPSVAKPATGSSAVAAGTPVLRFSNDSDPSAGGSDYSQALIDVGKGGEYGADDLGIAGLPSDTKVKIVRDPSQGDIRIVNTGEWNDIKGVAILNKIGGNIEIEHFVDVDLTLGDSGSNVAIGGAKRGSITAGGGVDKITVEALSNADSDNLMEIKTGAGNDSISFTGAGNTTFDIRGGAGNDTMSAFGAAMGKFYGDAGDDRISIFTSGQTTATGGDGSDAFIIGEKAHAIITDYVAGEDRLRIDGVTKDELKMTQTDQGLKLSFGSGSVLLADSSTKPVAGKDLFFS